MIYFISLLSEYAEESTSNIHSVVLYSIKRVCWFLGSNRLQLHPQKWATVAATREELALNSSSSRRRIGLSEFQAAVII